MSRYKHYRIGVTISMSYHSDLVVTQYIKSTDAKGTCKVNQYNTHMEEIVEF